MQIAIKTGDSGIDSLMPLIRGFLAKDVLEVTIDGQRIRGYRSPDARSIWIRDYSDMMRGCKYFEPDMTSVVEHFAATQTENGRIFDYFTTFPEKLPSERENWTKYVRVPVEADVEYRFVKAAYLAWQATGDDDWILRLLPRMEKALMYILRHPWRWEAEHDLVKRPYTIDTWDFAYTAGKSDWLQFQIDEETYWGIFHGDNSGYYEAFRIMERLYDHFNMVPGTIWQRRADELRTRMNEVCWNGSFYTHFVALNPVEIAGCDEARQLSLSNPMAINRGAATPEMAVSIIEEYQKRREQTNAFAEWFSIDPPFPDGVFGDEKLMGGAYVNGGIMPLVGGELARAAFEHGFEAYGVDILRRYAAIIAEKGETYLWYHPDGNPASIETSTSPEAEPTDGWGSSAMLYALIEGLAGIEDREKLFQKVRLAPRWAAAGVRQAEVALSYASSGAQFGYTYGQKNDRIILEIAGQGDIDCHVLLPEGAEVERVLTGPDERADHKVVSVRQSKYVDFSLTVQEARVIYIYLKA